MASNDKQTKSITVKSNIFKAGATIKVPASSTSGIFTAKKKSQLIVLSGEPKGIKVITKQKLTGQCAVTIPCDGQIQFKNESNSSYLVTFK